MNTKAILVLLCVISCSLAKDLRRHRERPRHGGWETHSFRPQRMDYGYQQHKNDDFEGWGSRWERPNGGHLKPLNHHDLPPFMTVGLPEEDVEEEVEEPSRPALPSRPLNPVLNTLSDLPLSLYNSYICNMFGTQQVSPNIGANMIRHKRALFSIDFFHVLRDFRRVVRESYIKLKPFMSQPDNQLLTRIQNIALKLMDSFSKRRLQVSEIVQAFIEEEMQSEGLVGSAQTVYEAIQKLSNEKKSDIEESTLEAVDNSCGVINNKFYCTYMKKLSASSGCSGNFFSTEILDKCCSAFEPTIEVEPTGEGTLILATEKTPTVVDTTTEQAPQAPETTTPTPEVVPTAPSTAKPVAATTQTPTTAKPVAATTQTPTTAKPLVATTQTPTTAAPVVTTTTAAATTTPAPKSSCGISTVNPAQGFSDFSSAMNQVRIVGGVDTEKCEYPWMVRLQVGNSLCGGSIIDETHILTAGHCIGTNTPSDITVHAGEYDYNTLDNEDVTHTVKAIDVHEEYTEFSSGGVENDAAILTLDEPLEYNDCVQPICLPSAGDGAAIEAGTQCVVAGWGTTSSGGQTSNILKEVTIPTYSGADCDSVFTETTPSNPDIQLCAGRPLIGEADSCQGDSGGPLFCPVNGQYVQYGIVSYGSGCADVGAAGVYADTSAMLDFINRITGA